MMKLQDLHYYQALTENLCFRQTAADFEVSQSTISRAISRLEDRLGAQLFSREGRKVQPSSFGRAMEPALLDLHARLRELESHADTVLRSKASSLRLGIDESVALDRLAPLLEAYKNRYPNIELQIVRGPSHALQLNLTDDCLDAAICYSATGIDDQCRSIPLCSEPYVIASRPQIPAWDRHGRPAGFNGNPLAVNITAISGNQLTSIFAALPCPAPTILKCERIEEVTSHLTPDGTYGLLPRSLAAELGLRIHWQTPEHLPRYELGFVVVRGRIFSPALRTLNREALLFAKDVLAPRIRAAAE